MQSLLDIYNKGKEVNTTTELLNIHFNKLPMPTYTITL